MLQLSASFVYAALGQARQARHCTDFQFSNVREWNNVLPEPSETPSRPCSSAMRDRKSDEPATRERLPLMPAVAVVEMKDVFVVDFTVLEMLGTVRCVGC